MKALRILLILSVLLAAYSAVVIGLLWPGIGIVLGICVIAALGKKGVELTAHGRARWADEGDIPHLLGGNGLIVGHIESKASKLAGVKALFSRLPSRLAVQRFLASCQRKSAKLLVRLNTACHTMIVAPTGGGKGVSCATPFLLTNQESAVVVDLSGELVRNTSAARRAMHHKVVILDPYKVVSQSPDTFNPLDAIDGQSEQMFDECKDLANALVVRTGQEKDPHWNDRAEENIGNILCAIAHFAEPEDRSLQAMRNILANEEKRGEVLKLMQSSDAFGGIMSRLGNAIAHHGKEELGGILSTVQRHTRFLDTPAIVANTQGKSSFNPAELKTGRMTVYLVMPPEHMRAQSALLRMWIASMFRACIRGGAQESRKVNFIIDEAAALGRMDAINDAIDKYRKFGIRLQLYFQSLGQLRVSFPEDQGQTALSNTTQVFFGINDYPTAEYVSNRLGDHTMIITSGGTGEGESFQHSQGGNNSYSNSHNNNSNWAQHGRKLLKVEEVLALPERIAITFTPGVPPMWTRLIRFYERGSLKSGGIGTVKAVVDTVCLFLLAAMVAFLSTGIYLQR